MNFPQINIGAFLDDPTAERVRDAFEKVNDWGAFVESVLNPGTKVTEVFRGFTSGSGTLQEQAAASINAGAQFTIPPNQLGVVSFVTFLGGGGASSLDLVRHSFILEVGAGTYGAGGTTIPADKIIELAPVSVGVITAFRFQLGDIGTAEIEDFVNGSGPYTIVGLSVFEATQNGDDKVWLFTGGNGTWGDGATPVTADMFVDLTAQDPIPSPTVSYLPVKTITTTPYTITDDDLNRPLVFTSNNQVVNVPEAMPEASPQFLLFDFKAHFTGTGTHTVNYPDSETWTGGQGALIYALCIDTSGDTEWIVKEWEKEVDESKWEIKGILPLKIPTQAEWANEISSWGSANTSGAFGSPLKLSTGGYREDNGALNFVNSRGIYYSSTASGQLARYIEFSTTVTQSVLNRVYACSIRLILDGDFTLQEFGDNYENESFELDGLTYGFVYNPTTNKIWVDRNLGATQVATSSSDTDSYGDLYQWGRSPDGHQLRTSPTHNGDTLGKPSTANESGAWDGDFITTSVSPLDWLDPQDNNLWQGTEGFVDSFEEIGQEKLIGKNGLKADYNDLLNKPLRPDPTDNNRPEWDNGTEWKGLAYVDEIPVLANTVIKNQPYDYPDWFTGFKIPISVLNGNVTHNFDVTRHVENKIGGRFEDVLTVRYVSPSGNNSNDGLTPANAKLTVQNAISDGGELIYMLPGTYLRDSFLSGNLSLTSGQRVFLIGVGDVFITNAQGGLSWSLDSDDTYSTTRSGVADVIDKAFTNSDGYPLEYPLVGDLATCKATAGSWFQSGSTLYVHCLDGRSPDANVLPEISISNNITGTDGIFYLENVVFAKVAYTIIADAGSPEVYVYMKSVVRPYTIFDVAATSRHNDFYFSSALEVIVQKCISINARRDGFNYTDTRGVGGCKILEIDCFVSNPGTDDINTNNQCSSAHLAISILRINGSYYGGNDTTIADVNSGTQSVILGCEINASKPETTYSLALVDADVFGCKIYGNKLIGEVDESEGGITVRNSILEISGTTGEVTIES